MSRYSINWALLALVGATTIANCLLPFFPHAQISIKMRWEGNPNASGQVFWSTQHDQFSGFESESFPLVTGGVTNATIPIPDQINGLRFDPSNDVGHILIERISLYGLAPFLPIRTWDAKNKFSGLVPKQDVQVKGMQDGALDVLATGNDSIFILELPKRFSFYVELERFLISALLGLIASTLIIKFFPWKIPAHPMDDNVHSPVSATRLLAPKTLLFLGSSTVAIVLGLLSFHPLVRLFHHQKMKSLLGDEYEMSFFDRRGNRISLKNGPLKMAIDPFTVYRPLPSQKTPSFTINAQGFRESGGDVNLPIAFVTGGSTAFGVGASTDFQTFIALLNQSQKTFNVMNAGAPGWRAEHEFAYMTHVLDSYHPKRYISFSGWNDNHSAEIPAGGYQFMELEKALIAHYQSTANDGTSPLVPPSTEMSPETLNTAISNFVSTQERMAAFARARGATFTLVLQPSLAMKKSLNETERKWLENWRGNAWPKRPGFHQDYEKLVNVTIDRCKQLKMTCIDLLHSADFNDTDKMLFVDPVHLNKEGNQLVAKKLTVLLR